MTKIDALRRFLLPCFTTTPTAPTPPPHHLTNPTKKRLSTSLRDDIIDDNTKQQEDKKSLEDDNDYQDSYSNSSTSTLGARPINISYSTPRSSKTMVIGTIYGQRPRGNGGSHVWFSVQHDRTNTKPSLLLELSIPITTLIQEMKSGLVRIALEFKSASSGSGQNNPDLTRVPLHLIPMWTLFMNGRNVGFAVRRRASRETRVMLKTMQNMTVGAGVIPSGLGSGSGTGTDPTRVGGEEVLYMRANYECIIGGADSESFHLINPDENGSGQEFSIFLLRSK